MSNLQILNQSIRTFENLYSLNDLHIASGSENKHRPALFARLDQTKDLITEIQKDEKTENILVTRNGIGTYACEELVIVYAMWISPKFHLIVLRAFLAMQCTATNHNSSPCLNRKNSRLHLLSMNFNSLFGCGSLSNVASALSNISKKPLEF